MADHYAASLTHLEAVEAARTSLAGLHAQDFPNRKAIAQAYDDINHNLKLADVHSQLAIGQALRDAVSAKTYQVHL